jgi:hypothetical protein
MKRREEGSIVEREKGRKYLIRWTSLDKLTGENKRHNKIVRGDYVEAQSELSKMLRPDVAANHAKPNERTFSDYAEREWAQYTRDNWEESTQIVQGSFVRVHIVRSLVRCCFRGSSQRISWSSTQRRRRKV